MKPAVGARASQDGLVMRGPLYLGIEHSPTWVFHRILLLFNLEDLILVRLKAVQLELEVPEVPEGNSLVCTASGQDELGVGIEAEAVHLDTEYIYHVVEQILCCKKPLQCAHRQCGLVGWLWRFLCPRFAVSDHPPLT